MMPSFQVRSLTPGVLFDFGQGRETIQAFGVGRRDHPALFTSSGSFAGFVTEGAAKIETPANNLELPAGAYFAARGRCIVSGGARGSLSKSLTIRPFQSFPARSNTTGASPGDEALCSSLLASAAARASVRSISWPVLCSSCRL